MPHTRARRTLVVVADPATVRVLDGAEVVATHTRSYSRGEQIEEPKHIAALVAAKRARLARTAASTACTGRCRGPSSCSSCSRERGDNLGVATSALLRLLDLYGAQALDRAVAEALAKDSPHPHTVRLILERQRQGSAARLPLSLPDDPRVRELVVRPHDLASYDTLIEVRRR